MPSLRTSALHSDFAVEVHANIHDLLKSADAIAELKRLWQASPVMIFRRQALDEAELVDFSNEFGTCEVFGRKDIISPYSDKIIYFSTLKYSDGRFVGGFAGGEDVDWHSDQTFQVRPATGAILYGTEVPRDGGDIYWANQYGAWELLPDDVKQLIDGRMATYRYAKRYAILNPLELKDKAAANAMLNLPDARHAVVLTHPHTGRKALYADPTTLLSIDGLTQEQNDRVLPILFAAGGDPSLAYRHKVRNGDLMMWDNGCTMHRRDPMTLAQPRLMKRTTFRLSARDYCTPQA
ncbi:TauD/TfdA family dioxygenase [Diaphorobacter sp. HDW4A]|uniref:TauD/TfdA dioxygenase family protein n=1 Tax=Diaphorobacter sp. HDW4A TaxID=2714924 RepID=UPI001408B50F|nr:TauD/TfdA family dioxygenase [Diaphorobacter sp. HDW4A]QIL79978.1 TauD/TfdA family dioxygenase [Diaphorobacter sp. HDW4A]